MRVLKRYVKFKNKYLLFMLLKKVAKIILLKEVS